MKKLSQITYFWYLEDSNMLWSFSAVFDNIPSWQVSFSLLRIMLNYMEETITVCLQIDSLVSFIHNYEEKKQACFLEREEGR